jgi:hypothetical protein
VYWQNPVSTSAFPAALTEEEATFTIFLTPKFGGIVPKVEIELTWQGT